MEFNHTDRLIDEKVVERCRCQFQKIIIDLGLSKQNTCIGSLKGGNNFQLLVLMALNHSLTADSVKIQVTDNEIIWGADYLSKTSSVDIRNDLDGIFPLIQEKNKLLALSLETLVNGKAFQETFENCKKDFPDVDKALECGEYKTHGLLPYQELIFAYALCSRLANELDNNETSHVSNVMDILVHFEPEVLFLSIRYFIGLNRIIHYELDLKSPSFDKMIDKLNQMICYQ